MPWQPNKEPRTDYLHMRMSPTERARLARVVEATGLEQSALIRHLIAEKARELGVLR